MTWTKFGSEFFPECLHHGLPDAAVRTHAEAISYLYEVEEMSCLIPKRLVRTFAGSENFQEAIEALLSIEWWAEVGPDYEVKHHADVIRQSLAAQRKQRETSKKTSAKYRSKKGSQGDVEGPEVTRHVTPNADRQTNKHLEDDPNTTCKHRHNPDAVVDPWLVVAACDLCPSQDERRSA